MALKYFTALVMVAAVQVSADVFSETTKGRYYTDGQAAAEYESNMGDELVMTQLVNATEGETFDAWIKYTWLPEAEEVTPGVGRGYVNHTRLAPSLQITEQITSAGLPSDDDELAIPTVLYKVREPGMFPIDDHIAFVRFIQDFSQATPQTEVVWTIKLTLSAEGNAMFPNPLDLPPTVKNAITATLAVLAQTVNDLNQVA